MRRNASLPLLAACTSLATGRLLLRPPCEDADWPPTIGPAVGRLPLAARLVAADGCPLATGRRLRAACYWPPSIVADCWPLAAHQWPPTVGSPLLAACLNMAQAFDFKRLAPKCLVGVKRKLDLWTWERVQCGCPAANRVCRCRCSSTAVFQDRRPFCSRSVLFAHYTTSGRHVGRGTHGLLNPPTQGKSNSMRICAGQTRLCVKIMRSCKAVAWLPQTQLHVQGCSLFWLRKRRPPRSFAS